jgi:glutamine phosphoribosylpyrophosphate amidotransferase
MCGILGIILTEKAKSGEIGPLAVDCLTALQHRYLLTILTFSLFYRGTEGSGLVGTDGTEQTHFEIVKGHGLVRDVYSAENLVKFKGIFKYSL